MFSDRKITLVLNVEGNRRKGKVYFLTKRYIVTGEKYIYSSVLDLCLG